MGILADIAIGSGALLAAAYCMLLSRRLRAFTRLDGDVGRAIALLSKTGRPVDPSVVCGRGWLCRARTGVARTDHCRRTGSTATGAVDGGGSAPCRQDHCRPTKRRLVRRVGRVRTAGPRARTRTTPAHDPHPNGDTRMTVNTKLRGAGMGAVLFLVAALLFVAGLSRLSLGVASAVAAEDTAPEPPESAVEIPDGGALFDALRAREARLLEQEKALADRSDALRAAEAQLRRQLDELQAAESRLAATLAQTESAAENDLSRLTTVFLNT